ncbi:hypothetical protein Dsin_023434 [Dipteronia sinensis]|uniref:Gnk2-homologous domain-containing protein n=1 Tax=Dipteronia sinensis TaxID=43782 RepID=A0AAE0E116_9ROSI|nr:hypothetical protein Dsin_023434 [Dipteronia sinensis]
MGFLNLFLFFFSSYMLMSMSFTLSQNLKCYPTQKFTTNSTYDKNRKLILASLASKVAVNGGFYNTTIGHEPNKVYGLAVCRGDSTPEICNECVHLSVQQILSDCPNQKEVIFWGQDPQCIVRYADHSIVGKLEMRPEVVGYTVDNVTSNLTGFHQLWEGVMDGLVTKASMGSSRLKFGTGEAVFTMFLKIFALMQCTPDISQNDCNHCLRHIVLDFQTCCGQREGGYIYRPSCFFRWDFYPFYKVNITQSTGTKTNTTSNTTTNTTVRNSGGGGIATSIVVIIVVLIISGQFRC